MRGKITTRAVDALTAARGAETVLCKGGWKLVDDHLVPGKATTVLIQQKEKGWGVTHPENIRTGEWEFAIFTAAGAQIPVNPEKDCMPCHKEVAATDYNFQVSRVLVEQARLL